MSKHIKHREAFAVCLSADLHFDPYWVKYRLSAHGWPSLARGHRTADSRSGLHGDEQDLGRYPAYWKRGLLLTFRNGEGAAALPEAGGWLEMEFGAVLPGSVNVGSAGFSYFTTQVSRAPARGGVHTTVKYSDVFRYFTEDKVQIHSCKNTP